MQFLFKSTQTITTESYEDFFFPFAISITNHVFLTVTSIVSLMLQSSIPFPILHPVCCALLHIFPMFYPLKMQKPGLPTPSQVSACNPSLALKVMLDLRSSTFPDDIPFCVAPLTSLWEDERTGKNCARFETQSLIHSAGPRYEMIEKDNIGGRADSEAARQMLQA